MAARQSIRYASFLRRFVATVIDSIILSLIGIGISMMLGRDAFNTTEKDAIAMVDYALTLFISVGYVVTFWVKRDGQTLGKQIMHIKVITESGKPFDWFTAIVRYVGQIISTIPLFLGFLWALIDKKNQTWHDKIAKTYVIESDTKAPSKIIYVIGCLIPALCMLAFMALFMIGVAIGFKEGLGKIDFSKNLQSEIEDAVTQMNPEAKTHFDRSVELFKQIRSQGADEQAVTRLSNENIDELKKALDIEPNNARIWFELGNAYTWMNTRGTVEDAVSAYKKAEELAPKNTVYINILGDYYLQLNRNEEAVLQYQKTLRLTDESGYAYLGLGKAYKALKIYDKAKENLEKALAQFKSTNDEGRFDKDILETEKMLAEMQSK